MSTQIISYDPKYKQAFYDVNIAWFEEYFSIEPEQVTMLRDPEGTIIDSGGEVFFALENGKAVGAVALKTYGDGVYELTKLGVAQDAKGGGHGRRLCEAVIDRFEALCGSLLFLETHTVLKPAMALYKKLGFVIADNPMGDVYKGTDTYMEWRPEKQRELAP